MKECDTNDDGELDRDEWKALSDRSLEAILERHALARGNDDEFIDEFLDMAVPYQCANQILWRLRAFDATSRPLFDLHAGYRL